MAIFEREQNDNVVFPPKQGESMEVVVTSMKKVEQTEFPERNLKASVAKGGKDYGYYYELTLEDGRIMPVNTWALYFAFQETGVDFGEKISINHPARGKYIIIRLSPSKKEQDVWAE